jgi:hypothetical protein
MISVLPAWRAQRISLPPDARAFFAITTAGMASFAHAASLPVRWCRTLPGSWGCGVDGGREDMARPRQKDQRMPSVVVVPLPSLERSSSRIARTRHSAR